MLNPKVFFRIAVSLAEAAVVNPSGTKTLLANGLRTFTIKGKPFPSNGPKSLPRNCPNCTILNNWAFENCVLADKSFAKALKILETCLLVNNNLWGKLVSSLHLLTVFNEIFKVI